MISKIEIVSILVILGLNFFKKYFFDSEVFKGFVIKFY